MIMMVSKHHMAALWQQDQEKLKREHQRRRRAELKLRHMNRMHENNKNEYTVQYMQEDQRKRFTKEMEMKKCAGERT